MKGKIKDMAHVSDNNSKRFVDNLYGQTARMQNLGLEVEIQHGVCDVTFSAIVIGREAKEGDK